MVFAVEFKNEEAADGFARAVAEFSLSTVEVVGRIARVEAAKLSQRIAAAAIEAGGHWVRSGWRVS